jgi:DNA uptake protein ComE-like DNA-binding protein
MGRAWTLTLLLLGIAAPVGARGVERDGANPMERAAPHARELQRDVAHSTDARSRDTSRPRTSKKPAVAGVLNVNRATEAELKLLPGIGRGRAHAIVERREKRPFSSLDELARMKGMKGVVRRLRSHLTVDGETTLRPAGA